MSVIIFESYSIGVIVRIVFVRDRDVVMNGLIRYSIFLGNEEGIFVINFFTGVLILVKVFDYELC